VQREGTDQEYGTCRYLFLHGDSVRSVGRSVDRSVGSKGAARERDRERDSGEFALAHGPPVSREPRAVSHRVRCECEHSSSARPRRSFLVSLHLSASA